MNETRYYGKVRDMYITAVFENAQKVSLSKDINDACNLNDAQQTWARKHLGAIIIKATTIYKEIV